VGEQLLSPVTPDASLICQGLNYASHAQGKRITRDRKSNLLFLQGRLIDHWDPTTTSFGPERGRAVGLRGGVRAGHASRAGSGCSHRRDEHW